MANDLDRIRVIKSFPLLIKYLRDNLGWEFETDNVEDLTFDYEPEELGIDAHNAPKILDIKQLRPLVTDQPWGIFYINFDAKHLPIGALRGVLRGLVKRKRASANRSDLAAWEQENLLFICTSNNFQNFNFAYFRGAQTNRAVLASFGWRQGDSYVRTLLEHNLSALAFPSDTTDAEGWLKKWRAAFDVEAVTDKFFADYRLVFEAIEKEVKKSIKSEEGTRLFTQRLFNRLMFLYFIQKKGWLAFEGDKNYLRALFRAAESKGENFLRERLFYVFFWGMSNVGESRETHTLEALRKKRGDVPYLNGGLFDIEDDYDSDRDKVKISNSSFAKIFDLFERYNFTIEESTPLNVQVAVDPEMLGKVFEELVTGREARQDAGRYYTPRSIVSFMCRESLKKYLGGYEALVDERRADAVSVPEANDLLSKLNKLKVVDPACGSGAYLLGMLHELHALTNLLQTRAKQATARDDYKRKLNIIERNLYGVDRDNLAVQIARFRLWLSLVVEYDDSTGIDDLPTLPNLDFKIECGDSLTAPNPEKVKSGSFRTELIKQYREAKAKFLSAQGDEKGDLKKEIQQLGETIRHEAAFWLYGNVTFEGFDWAIEFADVFDNGGFDVVLANPPYGATVADNVRDLYFDRRTEGAQSKDTYGLFIARGLQLLCEGGQLCFIVSDTWRTIKTHKPLRRRLVEKMTVWHVLDLPVWIFNATVNTGILTLTKRAATDGHQLIAGDLRGIGRGDWDTLTKNLLAVAAQGVDVQTLAYARYTYPQNLIPTYDNCSFFIASPHLYKLMSDNDLIRFGSIGDAPHGLSTGNNKKYIRAEADVRGNHDLIEEWMKTPKEEIGNLSNEEKIKGLKKKWTELRGCFVPLEKGGESDPENGWLANYFVPTKYFINWAEGAIADMRKNKGFAWKNEKFFFKKGLTFSISGIYAPTFRLNSTGVFEAKGSGIFCDSIDDEVLLGIFCSMLARYQFKGFIKHSVDTSGDDIKELRLPQMDEQAKTAIKSLVCSIIEKQKADPRYLYHLHEQREIDALVYKLYGLTEEDIREVELWYCRRYSRLAEAQGMLREVQEKYADHLARCKRILAKPPAYWQSNPILTLIARGESSKLEFKETLEANNKTGESLPGLVLSALKTIAAFLNTDGGTLLIGASDSGEIKGLELDFKLCKKPNVDSFELKLHDLIKSRLKASPGKIKISFEPLPEGDVCRIDVEPCSGVTFVDGKDVYIRVGNRTDKLEGAALIEWSQGRSAR